MKYEDVLEGRILLQFSENRKPYILKEALRGATFRESVRQSCLKRRKIGLRRSIEYFAICIKSRPMTGTIPAVFYGIPRDNAVEMRAHG